MPISETAHDLLDAVDAHDLESLARMLRDDLEVTINDGGSMDRAGVLARLKAYFDAFSNLDFNFSAAEQTGNRLTVTYAISGTHDGVIDLRPLGYDIQAEPTGKTINLPQSSLITVFDDDGLVLAMTLNQAEGAGMPGVLSQLNIELPSVG